MNIIVVGSGVIGLNIAAKLAKEHSVRVISCDINPSTSYNNAGQIVPSNLVPFANIERSNRFIGSIMTPENGFLGMENSFEVWRYVLAMRKYKPQISGDLAHLLRRNSELIEGLPFYHKTGMLEIFVNKDKFKNRNVSVKHEVLSTKDIKERLPQSSSNVVGGVLYPQDGYINNQEYARYLRNGSFEIINDYISSWHDFGNFVEVKGSYNEYTCDLIVLATGASNLLHSSLGVKVLVGQGYGFEIKSTTPFKQAVILSETGTSLSYQGRVKVAGRLFVKKNQDGEISYPTIGKIYDELKNYFDFESHTPEKAWTGYRSLSENGLPIIKKFNRAIVANGHGMLGISLGAVTAEIVQELVNATI